MLERKSFFFTDPTKISQSASQAFGPVLGDEENKFRVTSKFTVTGDAMAYAICKGTVLIVPQTGSEDKVNLVLKPFDQPIKGLDIKYFIYRGLRKSDFFTNDGKVVTTSEAASGLIKNINEAFQYFHKDESVLPDFYSRYIGYFPELAISSNVDALFFNISSYEEVEEELLETESTAYELPNVEMGLSLGYFYEGEAGLDVVIDYGDYIDTNVNNDSFQFSVEYAQAIEALIDVSELITPYSVKLRREQIFQFLDLLAYFGSHSDKELGRVDSLVGNKVVSLSGSDIYNKLLNWGYSKNSWYLYILAERGRSYNFYGNYHFSSVNLNSLKIGPDKDSMAEAQYHTNNWPFVLINEVENKNDYSQVNLQLLTNGTRYRILNSRYVVNENEVVYGDFLSSTQLSESSLSQSDVIGVTKFIKLATPSVVVESSNLNISSFCFINFIGSTLKYIHDEYLDEDDNLVQEFKDIEFSKDAILIPITSRLIKSSDVVKFSSIVDKRRLLNTVLYPEGQAGILYNVVRVDEVVPSADSLGENVSRLTLFNGVYDSFCESDSKTENVLERDATGMVSEIKTEDISEGLALLSNIDFLNVSEGADSFVAVLIKRDKNKIALNTLIGLWGDEIAQVEDLVQEENLVNPSVLLEVDSEEYAVTANDNIQYNKFFLRVVAENSSGQLKAYDTSEKVEILTLDGQCFFSKEYGRSIRLSFEANQNYVIAESV